MVTAVSARQSAFPRTARLPKPPTVKAPKAPKADKIPRVKSTIAHPPYLTMITEMIATVKDRKGASSQSILKHISAQYSLGPVTDKRVRSRLAAALKRGVSSGALTQLSGKGANGHFKLNTGKPKDKSSSDASAPSTPRTPKKASKKVAKVASPSERKTKSTKKAAVKPLAKKGTKKSNKKEVAASATA